MRYRKILYIFTVVIVVIVVSLSSFSVAALTKYTNFNSFSYLNLAQLFIYKSSLGNYVDVTGSQSLHEVGNDIYYTMTTTESWGPGQRYRVYMSFELSPSVVSNCRYKGQFSIVGNATKYSFLKNFSNVYFSNSDGSYTYCDLSLNPSNSSELICRFDSQSAKEPQFLSLYFDFSTSVSFVANSTVCDFSLMYLDFSYISDSDVIIENQNNNTNTIINNQDKNASDIQANQDKNTDKIANGWQQEESIDTTTTDDYAAKDKELEDATEQGRSETVSVFNNFGSLFQSNGHLYKGLMSVSAIFTEFFKIDWVSSLINFSLALGVFAFVIGTGSAVFKSAHEKYSNKKSFSEERSSE